LGIREYRGAAWLATMNFRRGEYCAPSGFLVFSNQIDIDDRL
jgi:hypothetical protein